MRRLLIIFFLVLLASSASAKIRTEHVEYRHGEAVLEGYLAYDDEIRDKRPGVLVVHEWWGINDHTMKKTEEAARLGYVAFAADIFGKGIRPSTAEEASKQAEKYRGDRMLLRERAKAGLEALRSNSLVDKGRLAAIGFCFGGTTALELARGGADVRGVVSFHGGLSTPSPSDAKNIKGKVLALHGADDPYVKAPEVAAFQDEMRKAGVDWSIVSYGGAVHSFTNPASGSDPSRGLAYNEKADRRSWEAMKDFLGEVFK